MTLETIMSETAMLSKSSDFWSRVVVLGIGSLHDPSKVFPSGGKERSSRGQRLWNVSLPNVHCSETRDESSDRIEHKFYPRADSPSALRPGQPLRTPTAPYTQCSELAVENQGLHEVPGSGLCSRFCWFIRSGSTKRELGLGSQR